MIGARVGNWFLEAELAHGAQGIVYSARGFEDASRRAAVKILTDARTRDPAFLQRFPGEMLALHRLNHANVVRFFDCGTHGGLAWYATELVEGTDLATRLGEGRLPWREVFSIAVQAAHALRHGHMRNILHRDLKPAHFLWTPRGTLKLADFGIAKFVPQPPPSPTPPLGSAAYLPPETANGKPLTRRSDIYSLGGVLYTLLTGRPLFSASSMVELLHKQCYALPERPGMLVPDLPAEIDEFVRALLDKNPSRRPGSAVAVLEMLDRIRGKLERKGETLPCPPDPGTGVSEALGEHALAERSAEEEGEPSGSGRPRLRFAVLLLLFLLAVGGLGYAFFRPGPSAESLFVAAQPLLNSQDPADWERAWDEYLEPLARNYPDQFTQEVSVARTRIQDAREQRRTLALGAKVEPKSGAEAAYLRGLRLAQAGDARAARATWQALVTAFAAVAFEQRWVDLARQGLEQLAKTGRHTPSLDGRSLQAALESTKRHRVAGQDHEAEAILTALEELYRGDAEALRIIGEVQQP